MLVVHNIARGHDDTIRRRAGDSVGALIDLAHPKRVTQREGVSGTAVIVLRGDGPHFVSEAQSNILERL